MRYDVALLRALFPHVRAHSERVRMPLRGLSSRQSVSLRLITPRQTAFHARDEELARFPWAQSLPGVDHESSWPWWGFCWPGGWTLASYVAKMEARKRVVALDLGSGGGVVGLSLAQALSRSSSQELRELVVVFNDIDPYSLAAAALNVEEGGLVDTDARFEYCVENLVGAKPDATTLVRAFAETNDATLDETLLLVLAGDILYDGEFGAQALDWLRSLAATKGDPNPKVEVVRFVHRKSTTPHRQR